MSDLQKRPANAPVQSNWSALAKQADTNPLMLVPEGCRLAITRLWMCNAHMMPSALALCARTRVYLDERTVTAADIERIALRLSTPGKAANHKFAGELLAEFAALVTEAEKANRARMECEARRVSEEGTVGPGAVNVSDLFKLRE